MRTDSRQKRPHAPLRRPMGLPINNVYTERGFGPKADHIVREVTWIRLPKRTRRDRVQSLNYFVIIIYGGPQGCQGQNSSERGKLEGEMAKGGCRMGSHTQSCSGSASGGVSVTLSCSNKSIVSSVFESVKDKATSE